MRAALFSPLPKHDCKVVDRIARDQAGLLLRKFAAGQMTNDAFEDGMPITRDPSTDAVWDTAWVYYHDTKRHFLTGPNRLHPDAKRAWIRWILFLDSDCKYLWPRIQHPGNDPAAGSVDFLGRMRRFLGRADVPNNYEQFGNAGHYAVWPFISQKDYRQARRIPRRFGAAKR